MADEQVRVAVGAALRAMREAKGYTASDVAEALGESGANLSRWEHGKVLPSPDRLKRMATLYGTTTDALIPAPSDHSALVAKARELEAKINRKG